MTSIGSPIRTINNYVIKKDELLRRILELEETLKHREAALVEQTILTEENNALREQLKFTKRTARIPLQSYVVGKTIDNTGNTLIIDKGARDGVQEKSAVIVGDGILVGKIIKVNPKTAIIRLINDPHSKIAATVLNEDKSIGLVEGGFGISVKLTTVLQTEVLKEGDLIITSGLEETVPRGLLIGSITKVEKEDYRPFQEGIIQPAATLARLTLVGILPVE
ncbi:rod shape-determining protein MreC [Candidatus Uhrbacteria bacterium RIFCSPLOWO2_02_FULL_51_9]|uniref:Cell shape-determining protein MreC n=1 Tax=Candidatus Uhrbacteria bacterium RIFCSPLOWO2_02_FULL_51_9 TaxID=1802410 RepID=A0A1F7VD72_9BACT|nr:MAG: rod shape-determining protein MreC [Candidatus Uhrbacteria bacterium RIFCSPLOWO2_02_FULL_51_9]